MKFNYSTADWGLIDYLATLTFTNIILLMYAASLTKLGLEIPFAIRWSLLIWTGLCTLALASTFFSINPKYSKLASPLKYVATLATVVFTLMSGSMFDADIASHTHIDPSELPATQRLLTFVGVVYFWAYTLFWLSLLLYPVLFSILIFKLGDSKKPPTDLSQFVRRESIIAGTLLGGLSFTFIIITNGFIALSEDLSRRRIKEFIVFSSFHLKPEVCAIYGRPETAKIALIKDKKALVAVQDVEFIYKFTTEDCYLQPVEYKSTRTDKKS